MVKWVGEGLVGEYSHVRVLCLDLGVIFSEKEQEPITQSLHLCCTLESTLSNEELFLEQAFPRKSIVSENVNVNEHD